MSKDVERKVADLIADGIAAMGYELVRVRIMGGGKHAALQIMAERKDGSGMTVEDCAAISRQASEKIEADPALAERYALEVSSPGIDRPLVRMKDYERYKGHVAKIELDAPVEGRKKFEGKIARVAGDAIVFEADKESLSVPFAAIEKAKLIMTDELLKAAMSGKASH
ncbi:MAG: ribosome maturation factor RimP [Alphaproteobacteria bacterium]|nr:ribosome maturation factor RimP [Alphaproteobacteria bacterium]